MSIIRGLESLKRAIEFEKELHARLARWERAHAEYIEAHRDHFVGDGLVGNE